jgi:hypothetical protein
MRFKTAGLLALAVFAVSFGPFNLSRWPAHAAVPTVLEAPTTTPALSIAVSEVLPYRKDIDRFFNRLGEGKINDAMTLFDLLFSTNAGSRDKMQRSFSSLYGTAGKYKGNEIISLTTVSSQLQRVECMAYFDSHYFLFSFIFWHRIGDPPDQWQDVGFNVYADNDAIFKDRQAVEYHEAVHPAGLAEPLPK